MAGRTHENAHHLLSAEARLPFAALQLLAPPVRLVSAALWKVIKQRDAMQYGVVEEFVTSACETVPGLLTVRHQGKLALGLRGRLILELCQKQPDEEVITPHLERIRIPAAMSGSGHIQKRDLKIQRTVENFHLLVRTLLKDAAEREQFFKEEFPVEYGLEFDQELEKLLWEFLIRVDQLLPAPSLARTVSWLSEAPPVLEECARSATQPQLLKLLLQHQACLGHLETAASLPPNMGDSILASLSLPPSGRAASKEPTGSKMAVAGPSDDTQIQTETLFITPVIGIISSEEVPVMISADKRTLRDGDAGKVGGEQTVERKVGEPIAGIKRKRSDKGESGEEGGIHGEVGSEEQGMDRSLGRFTSLLKPDRESGKERKDCKRDLGLEWPEDASLCSSFEPCVNNQPVVVLNRMPATAVSGSSSKAEKSPYAKWQNWRRQKTSSRPSSAFPALDNKENLPTLRRSPQQRSPAEPAGDSEDYVADSEDEATKNFKDRLFVKRYCRTRHGTYVPTLREYFRPRMARRNLLSMGGKRR
ncbi:TERF1-interacting nuclear factor 2 isoform X1 [Takifugu rubripes]|uniref:TERF1-interacting nuclear factor 2 isoform X1 n=1 Tax=Takifugu rubripes TaxID=31033 RepID=UPI0011455ACA|nr:TERF1-interacting nuclear factor 2 isoform X1 [Takifugu rubripes]